MLIMIACTPVTKIDIRCKFSRFRVILVIMAARAIGTGVQIVPVHSVQRLLNENELKTILKYPKFPGLACSLERMLFRDGLIWADTSKPLWSHTQDSSRTFAEYRPATSTKQWEKKALSLSRSASLL